MSPTLKHLLYERPELRYVADSVLLQIESEHAAEVEALKAELEKAKAVKPLDEADFKERFVVAWDRMGGKIFNDGSSFSRLYRELKATLLPFCLSTTAADPVAAIRAAMPEDKPWIFIVGHTTCKVVVGYLSDLKESIETGWTGVKAQLAEWAKPKVPTLEEAREALAKAGEVCYSQQSIDIVRRYLESQRSEP